MDMNNLGSEQCVRMHLGFRGLRINPPYRRVLLSRSRQTRRGKKKKKKVRSSRSNYANRCPRIYGISLFRKAFFLPVFKSRFLKILSSEIRRSNERIRRHDFEPITRFSFSARVNHYSEIYSLLFFYFYISEIYLVSSRLHGPSNFRTDSIP